MRSIRGLLQAVLLSLLVACGGGGDGGGGGGGAASTSITLDAPAVALELQPGGEFQGVYTTVNVSFRGDGVVVGTPPGDPALPQWLHVTAGAQDGDTIPFTIGYEQVGPAVSIGRYAVTLRFVTGKADGSELVYRDLPVVLTVLPEVTPGIVAAHAAVDGTPVSQDIRFNWGTLPWAVRTSAPWIQVDPSAGPAGGDPVVRVTLDPAGLAPGEHMGVVHVEEAVGRVAQEVPVYLVVEPRQLVVRQRGVALSQVGGRAQLSASLPIADNGGGGIAWTATSDRPWLTFTTAAGNTGAATSALSMTADPSGLADGLHYAQVTVSPGDASQVSGSVTVRVGLYVNRAATSLPAASVRTREPTSYPPFFAVGFVADPIRPYVYHTQGDGRIDVYDIHAGALVDHIDVPGAGVGAMAISFDGSRLFVADVSGSAIVPVNLDDRTVGGPYTGVRPASALAYTEVGGRPVVVTSELQAVDGLSGVLLADADDPGDPFDGSQSLAAQRDGRAVVFQTGSSGNHQLSRYMLAFQDGRLSMRRTHLILETGSGRGVAIDNADERVHTLAAQATASQGAVDVPASGFVYDARTLSAMRAAADCCDYGLAITASGRVLMGVGTGNPARIEVFDGQGRATASVPFAAGFQFVWLAVGGDAGRVGALGQAGGASEIHWRSLP